MKIASSNRAQGGAAQSCTKFHMEPFRVLSQHLVHPDHGNFHSSSSQRNNPSFKMKYLKGSVDHRI